MSLYLDNKVDPVAAAGGRELNFMPKHFTQINLGQTYYDTRTIRSWIWKNQSGRFCIGQRIKVTDNHMNSESVVGFEDPSEAVMFTFILPTLQNNLFDDF